MSSFNSIFFCLRFSTSCHTPHPDLSCVSDVTRDSSQKSSSSLTFNSTRRPDEKKSAATATTTITATATTAILKRSSENHLNKGFLTKKLFRGHYIATIAKKFTLTKKHLKKDFKKKDTFSQLTFDVRNM